MNTQITALLMAFRDKLKLEAKETLEPAETQLKTAKEIYHAAKIKSNGLLRQAQFVQDQITTEMQASYNTNLKVERAWSYSQPSKSDQELEQELLHKVSNGN